MMRKMGNKTRKVSGILRRVMACAMAVALCLPTLATVSPAEAAGFTKPKLAVKKKTLYYNKKGKKTYTLKVKSNKVKKVEGTTWKTSKKSVVSISKKKKMSVKLTAKKKGKATVTATVRYVPKGKWMVRTVSLKCIVTSKSAAAGKTTPPSGKTTPKPTAKPTNVPKVSDTQKAAKVELDQKEVVFSSTEDGKNTKVLTAVVKDAQGKEMKGQKITWSTDNDKVAEVKDGVVTAKKEGTANITASVDTVRSTPCAVVVDTTAPAVEGARVTDYKTITVYFGEAVEGDPEVSVTRTSSRDVLNMEAMLSEETVRMAPELSKDGRSLVLTSASALPEGTYNIDVTGLEDHAGNELEDGRATVIKAAGRPTGFVCRTEKIPAGQDEVSVYYNVVDQYGGELKGYAIEDLEAEAETESGMPLDISISKDKKNCVVLSGTIGKLAEGRKIQITLSSKSLGLESEFIVVLVDPDGAGKAVRIEQIITSIGDSETPEFTLSDTQTENIFTLSSELSDKFGSPVSEDVIYAIKGGKNIAEFVDENGDGRQTIGANSDAKVKVRAKNKGKLTITAYLASDDSLNKEITIKINPTALDKIIVGELAPGYNVQESKAKITLEPQGTGLTAEDLKCEAMDDISKERIQDIHCEEASDGSGIYVCVTAAGDGKSDKITFKVYYEDEKGNKIYSDKVYYESKPMLVVDSIHITPIRIPSFERDGEIPALKEVETSYQLLNRYGEDITKYIPEKTVTFSASGPVSVTNIKDGKMTIKGTNSGEAVITLKYGTSISSSISLDIKSPAVLSKVCFGQLPDGVDGLIIDDPKEEVYVPVTFYDQYGGTYPLSEKELRIKFGKEVKKLNGEEKVDSDLPVEISYCELSENGDYNKITTDDDDSKKVAAICLRYKSKDSVKVKPGDVLTVSLEDENITSDQFSIEFKEARRVNKLQLEKRSIPATPGTEVTNAVTLIDQYEDPIKLGQDQDLRVRVTKDNKEVTLTGNDAEVTEDKISHVTLSDKGIYEVRVYVAKKGEGGYTENLIQDKYTLEIDAMENLIDKIEISDKVKKGENKTVDLSEVECIRMNNTADTELEFSYRPFDKNDREIVGKINSSELSWSASGTNASAIITDDQWGKVIIKKMADNTSGSIQVNLIYARGPLSATKSVKVGNEPSKPKAGTYKIVIPTDSDSEVPFVDDVSVKTAEGETNPITATYKITAQDQYGDLMYVSNLSAVYADDVTVAGVTRKSDRFMVNAISETEKATKINVLLTTGETMSFVVKGKMMYDEKDITADWGGKAVKFAEKYYNKKEDITFEPSDDICYFTIPYNGDNSSVPSISSVKLGDEKLSKDVIPISVGNKNFVDVADYKQDEKGNLMVSYVFVALHNTNVANKMLFTVEFQDGTKSSAVLKVKDMQDNLYCTDVEAANEESKGGTVTVKKDDSDAGKITKCDLILSLGSAVSGNWKHLVYFSFSKPSDYYFTKRVYKDGSISYGFTEAEKNVEGKVLGYYPSRNGNNKKTVDYTVATVDRHGVAEIKIKEEDEKTSTESSE